MLSFNPNIPAGVVNISPAIPAEIDAINLDGVLLGSNRVNITARGKSGDISGLPAEIVRGMHNARSDGRGK
jgi:hypothetical protein